MKKFNILCLAAALTAPLLTGCSGSDAPDEPSVPESGSYTITLVAKDGAMNSRTGLPPLEDVGNEGKIYNVAILLYRKSLNDNTITSNDKIEYVFFYDNLGGVTTASNLQINKVLIGTYYATALVNFYNNSDTDTNKSDAISAWKGQSLATLQKAVYGGVPFENIANNDVNTYDRFRMVSDEEKALDFSKETVNGTVLPVERLTSRVDLKIKGLTPETDESNATTYKIQLYKCDADGNPLNASGQITSDPDYYVPVDGSYMELKAIYLENFNKTATYYIQRSASNASGTDDLKYFADEAFGKNDNYTDYASRYVLTPSTYDSESITLGNYGWLATKVNKDDALLSDLFCSDHLLTDYNSSTKTNPYYTLTYVGEYTNYSYSTSDGKLTGTYPYLKLNYEYESSTLDQSISNDGELIIPFLHTTATGTIDYSQPDVCAIIRNTVYRFSLCFFTNNELLYVRWYYYSNGASTETPYNAAINSIISNSQGGTPND